MFSRTCAGPLLAGELQGRGLHSDWVRLRADYVFELQQQRGNDFATAAMTLSAFLCLQRPFFLLYNIWL